MDEQVVEVATEVDGRTEGTTAADLAAVRELAIRAHPDVVPELVSGSSVAEVLGSVEGARAAYRRVVEAAGGAGAADGGPPSVPAGAVTRPAVDPERLPAAEKIRRGLVARR